jgi:outer membrane protein insertion porin family/translocation and assembly module TamA
VLARARDFLYKSVCSQLKDDDYSRKMNYYGGATLRQPVLLGVRTTPTITLFSSRASEFKSYLRTTYIGGKAAFDVRPRPTLPMTFAYQLERGRTESQPALFCAVFLICEARDQEALQKTKRSAVLSAAVTRDASVGPSGNPIHGSVAKLELRHASTYIAADPSLQFNKATFDASWYISALGDNVLALRMRAGAVIGGRLSLNQGAQEFIPLQERFLAGGAQTVRGFSQNLLGPLVYQAAVTAIDTVAGVDSLGRYSIWTARTTAPNGTRIDPDRRIPTGGNALVVANAEYRMRSPFLGELLQFTLFTDVGQVWNRRATEPSQRFRALRVTPGLGLRIFSPVGPIRFDLGYNPYAQQRGAAYFGTPQYAFSDPLHKGVVVSRPLFCVSPGNELKVRVRPVDPSDPNSPLAEAQDAGSCPATYQPVPRSTFLSRLNPTISIGQAF